jgi:hypothetical protein
MSVATWRASGPWPVVGAPRATPSGEGSTTRGVRSTTRDNVRRGCQADCPTFHVVYDAATETWTGTLTVAGRSVQGTASGVFRLLEGLDGDYRRATGM